MSLISIFLAILLLGILITVHEFGHFMAARLTGIEVMEFAIGFGPRLLGWTGKKSGTKFSLRAIPLGGFCAFYGEDDAEGKTTDDPRAYNNQSVWKRMFTVLMGPAMNFVLAFVVATCYYFFTGVAQVEPYLVEIEPSGPAYDADLEAGDVISHVDGEEILSGGIDALLAAIDGDQPLALTVLRGEETVETVCTPVWDEAAGKYRIGVTIGNRYTGEVLPMPFGQAVREGWNICVYASTVIIDSLIAMVTRGEGIDQTAGPVGVITIVSEQVQTYGFDAFVNYLVLISVNLGVMNLLPIPGLDGSRFLFMAVEAIRRKPVPRDKEAMIHLGGMLFLFAVMIFFTFRDVLRLFQ